jgi:hypothetical protein
VWGKAVAVSRYQNFYDFARLPSIFCDPLRSMVAPRQRERMNSPIKPKRKFGEARLARDLDRTRDSASGGYTQIGTEIEHADGSSITDSFIIKVSDGIAPPVDVVVNVTVAAVNDAPKTLQSTHPG